MCVSWLEVERKGWERSQGFYHMWERITGVLSYVGKDHRGFIICGKASQGFYHMYTEDKDIQKKLHCICKKKEKKLQWSLGTRLMKWPIIFPHWELTKYGKVYFFGCGYWSGRKCIHLNGQCSCMCTRALACISKLTQCS